MAEMERDMAGMDENNPDPRALGSTNKSSKNIPRVADSGRAKPR